MTSTTAPTRTSRSVQLLRNVRALGPARVLVLAVVTLLLAMSLWPGIFTSHSPTAIDSSNILNPPGNGHLLGTDEAGADVWARLVHATGLEITIAFGSVLVGGLIGVPLGLIAGMRGRALDWMLSSAASATLAFPLILFAILMVSSFGSTASTLTFIVGVLFIPRFFLLMRAQAKSLKEREFVTAAIVSGARPWRVILRHIVPNAAGPLATLVPQLMAEAILIEAGLSYLGLGVQLPDATWGTILEASKNYYVTAPFYAVAAGLTITVVAAVLMWAGELVAESANPLRNRRRS